MIAHKTLWHRATLLAVRALFFVGLLPFERACQIMYDYEIRLGYEPEWYAKAKAALEGVK